MSKKGSGSGAFGYMRRLIWGIVVCAITLGIIIWAFIDNWNNEPQQSKNMEMGAVNKIKNTYNKEAGPVSQYAQDRTNGDLHDAAPQIEQIKNLGKNVVNHVKRTPVSHVSLDDSGNGIFVLNHHQYLFKLNDTEFVPHNSQFYKKNQSSIQDSVAKETQGGQFYVTRTGKNGINLYKGHQLVANTFLRQGVAYMPNLTIKNPVTATQRSSESYAKHSKKGFWNIPDIVGGNANNQTYDIPAEQGHHINTTGNNNSSNNHKGGESATQHIKSWFGSH